MLRALVSRIGGLLSRSHPLWDAASSGKRTIHWPVNPASPNRYLDNPVALRARAEAEYRNNPVCRKAVDALVNAVSGANGIIPMFPSRGTQAAWERWGRNCDAAGRLDWAGIVGQVLQSTVISGEVFVQTIIDPAAGDVPLRLLILGPEYLDTSKSDNTTYAGIRYEGNRAVGYWLFKQNPAMTATFPESTFVPAANCLHIFRPITPGAQRGQTWLAPVLLPLRELNEFLEASLVRGKIAALFSGFVRTPDGSNPMLTPAGEPTLEPGSMVRLQPNEDISFTAPPDAGATFDPFVRAQLRRIAGGAGIPYEVLSGDSSQITFASGRHSLLEFRRTVESIQYGLLVPQLCEPVRQRWATLAAAMGAIDSAEEARRWIGPTIEMLDPRTDTAAQVQRIRAGLTSRSEAVAQSGWRVEDIDAEIAADNARADRLGLTLDSDPRKISGQGQVQPETAGGGASGQ